MTEITFTRPDAVSVASAGLGAAALAAAPAEGADDPSRRQAGELLVQLFRYLDANALDHPALLPVIGGLRDAVAGYRAGTAGDPLAGVRAVVAAIAAARAEDPALPEP